MTATSDQLTLVNLAHHSYFNLAGHGDILNHELAVFADQFTPDLITGEPKDVDGTPLDLRAPRRIGSDLPQVPGCPQGFDHNYLLQAPERAIQAAPPATAHDPAVEQAPLVARLVEPNSGRTLELSTNQPALQFYTGNYLDGRRGTPQTLQQHAGLCLESQAVPNYANVPAFAAQGTLRPGELYRHEMLLRFISP
jgi:aldose 1-epimerase